jgi:hypothetical protein
MIHPLVIFRSPMLHAASPVFLTANCGFVRDVDVRLCMST